MEKSCRRRGEELGDAVRAARGGVRVRHEAVEDLAAIGARVGGCEIDSVEEAADESFGVA